MPPLVQDPALTSQALAWAQNLASRDAFEHSHGPSGENLYVSTSTASRATSCSAAVKAWFDEYKLYNGEPIFNTPALFELYGHVN